MVERPAAGLHYPAATGEFLAWFSSDADCLDYLEWLRWPEGFVCPECGQGGWRLGDGRFECSGCGGAPRSPRARSSTAPGRR
ncbi:MAG: family transposase [Frankiales bacterium]|nr:family transposase [Frankiales bacterium]